ncbi:MAG: class I SAM-dependent methyltransferase [Chloroflexota bacterium]|nr:MAG: class I SAM-dependent methyltransferase [Chloroflexota bacterium]
MKPFSEAEIQLLIALIELSQPVETPNNIGYSFYPQTLEEAARYFRRFRLDWGEAYLSLAQKGLLAQVEGDHRLTPAGVVAAVRLRRERPPIYYWYRDYYIATATSQANAIFCERAYGKDLCQEGFMDMEQLALLLDLLHLAPGDRVLDLGCGNGMIAEYISDTTGAYVEGMDYIPEAVEQATARTWEKRQRLAFQVGNLDSIPYPDRSFDVILSADTLYMPNDLDATVAKMKQILRPGGKMGIFFSHALWGQPVAGKEALLPENTPLGKALQANGLSFKSIDLTQADLRHAQAKGPVAEELKTAFEAEGNSFLYAIRHGEAVDVMAAIQSGMQVRYLYLVEA